MSNGQPLLVQFGALEAASQSITTAINTLNSKLSDLESAAAPLIQSWAGEANLAYADRQGQWRRAAEDITTILTQINKALIDSSQQYLATERANTNLFS